LGKRRAEIYKTGLTISIRKHQIFYEPFGVIDCVAAARALAAGDPLGALNRGVLLNGS